MAHGLRWPATDATYRTQFKLKHKKTGCEEYEMAGLKLTGIKKSYGDVKTLHGIDLSIKDGEFVVFVGPSGCGKSKDSR